MIVLQRQAGPLRLLSHRKVKKMPQAMPVFCANDADMYIFPYAIPAGEK